MSRTCLGRLGDLYAVAVPRDGSVWDVLPGLYESRGAAEGEAEAHENAEVIRVRLEVAEGWYLP